VGVSLGTQPTESFAAGRQSADRRGRCARHCRACTSVRATRVDRGVWQLPAMGDGMKRAARRAAPRARSTSRSEAAAMDALGDDAAQVTSWTVTMQRPGLVGPFPHQDERACEAPTAFAV